MHLFVLQQLDLNLTGLNPLLWDSHEGGCLSTPLCVLVFRSHKHTYTHTYIRLQGTQTWQRCLKSESLCSSFHLSMWWVYSWTCLSPVGWSPGPGPDMVWSWCDHGVIMVLRPSFLYYQESGRLWRPFQPSGRLKWWDEPGVVDGWHRVAVVTVPFSFD